MIKVLVVEDEPGVQAALINTFRSVGYETFGASSAREALDLFRREKPDAVFLDIMLPDQSGIELLREMKALDKNNIVIMVSASGAPEVRRQALEAGAVEFISKPFFRESLRQALARNLGRLARTPAREKPKILIVDDEEDICISLNRYLQKRVEADIVITFDGHQARELISKNRFDIVFTDIKLPGKDGLTVIAETRDKARDTVFLVLTGYLSTELIQHARQAGVTEYFHKPMRLEDIYQKTRAILTARNKFIPKDGPE